MAVTPHHTTQLMEKSLQPSPFLEAQRWSAGWAIISHKINISRSYGSFVLLVMAWSWQASDHFQLMITFLQVIVGSNLKITSGYMLFCFLATVTAHVKILQTIIKPTLHCFFTSQTHFFLLALRNQFKKKIKKKETQKFWHMGCQCRRNMICNHNLETPRPPKQKKVPSFPDPNFKKRWSLRGHGPIELQVRRRRKLN